MALRSCPTPAALHPLPRPARPHASWQQDRSGKGRGGCGWRQAAAGVRVVRPSGPPLASVTHRTRCSVPPINPQRHGLVGLGRALPKTQQAGAVASAAAPPLTQESGGLRLESLEPYFYYLAKKWGVKAYGIEFREYLRTETETEQPLEPQDPDALLALPAAVPEGDLVKGVGVYAAQDIDATAGPKIIMEIPLPLMVTVSRDHPWMFYPNIVPLNHPIFEVIESTDPEGGWDLRLACLILLALDPASTRRRHLDQAVSQDHFGLQLGPHFLTEYCDFLPPPDDSPSLLLASEDELRELQDEVLADDIRQQQQRAQRFWKAHWGKAGEVPGELARLARSERQFLWALAQAQQRGVLRHAPMGTVDQDAHMFIPYADMLNHSFSPNCYFFWRHIDRVMEIRVLPGEFVQAGEELTIDYVEGGASNRQLMCKYSFSMPQNPWEQVEFSGEWKVHRESFLAAFDIVGYGQDYGYSEPIGEEDVDPLLDETVIASARCLPMWSDGARPCLPSEEIRGAKGLQQECLRMLRAFETTLPQDLSLLQGESSHRPATWTLAVKYRLDRKVFLLRLIESLEMYMERLVV